MRIPYLNKQNQRPPPPPPINNLSLTNYEDNQLE